MNFPSTVPGSQILGFQQKHLIGFGCPSFVFTLQVAYHLRRVKTEDHKGDCSALCYF